MMKTLKLFIAVLMLLSSALAVAETGVSRSAFTTGIENREPVDKITKLSNDHTKIYFFTEISDMYGHSITHRWELAGEVKAEVTFNVGGDRWRVWSSKTLDPSWVGDWQVSVVDEGGNVLAQEGFSYVAAGDMNQPASGGDGAMSEPAADMSGDGSTGMQEPAEESDAESEQPASATE